MKRPPAAVLAGTTTALGMVASSASGQFIEPVSRIEVPAEIVANFSFHEIRDGLSTVSGGTPSESSVVVIDVATGQVVAKFQKPGTLPDNATFGKNAALDDGRIVISTRITGRPTVFLGDLSNPDQLLGLDTPFAEDGEVTSSLSSVSIDRGLAAFGVGDYKLNGVRAAGVVYLYDVASGELRSRLTNDDPSAEGRFGRSVAVEGDRLVVGVTDGRGVAVIEASTGALLHRLLPADPHLPDGYGATVALANGIVAVGGIQEFATPQRSNGAVYLFDVDTGEPLRVLEPAAAGTGLWSFGQRITLAGRFVSVIAPDHRSCHTKVGSLFLFDAETGEQVAVLSASSGLIGNGPGGAVLGVPSSQQVLVYDLAALCLADTNQDGVSDPSDVAEFIDAFLNGDIVADLNWDCVLDFADIAKYVRLYVEGC